MGTDEESVLRLASTEPPGLERKKWHHSVQSGCFAESFRLESDLNAVEVPRHSRLQPPRPEPLFAKPESRRIHPQASPFPPPFPERVGNATGRVQTEHTLIDHQQEAAGTQYPRQFGQRRVGVGQMLQRFNAVDGIERGVPKRQAAEASGSQACPGNVRASRMEEDFRQVYAKQRGARSRKMSQKPPASAAGIQNLHPWARMQNVPDHGKLRGIARQLVRKPAVVPDLPEPVGDLPFETSIVDCTHVVSVQEMGQSRKLARTTRATNRDAVSL